MQVSAEVAAVSLDQPFELKKVQKSTDAEEGIRTAMQHCFLFAGTCTFSFCALDRQAACVHQQFKLLHKANLV